MLRCLRYQAALKRRRERLQVVQHREIRRMYRALEHDYIHMGYTGSARACLELQQFRHAAARMGVDLYATD